MSPKLKPSSGRRRVHPSQMVVGSYLMCDVYNEQGEIVLPRGERVTESHVKVLVARGLYYYPSDPRKLGNTDVRDEAENPFGVIWNAQVELKKLLTQPEESTFRSGILALGKHLRRVYKQDSDAALASTVLEAGEGYAVRHAVQTALTCYAISQVVSISVDETRSLVAAALTMNIGMIDYQDELQTFGGQLSADMKMAIRQHPEESVRMLENMGIADNRWLLAVEQHHEMVNGSGYPNGLKKDKISFLARIIGLADRYCAKMASRGYRDPVNANEALRYLLKAKATEDHDVLVSLVKAVGMYPPGVMVRLQNGETALVLHKTKNPSAPVVRVLRDERGPVREVVLRDTRYDAHRIAGVLSPNYLNKYAKSEKLAALWGYGELHISAASGKVDDTTAASPGLTTPSSDDT